MQLLVLAGGFGTRLKAAVRDVPKALAPVFDKPFLQLQIELWVSQGIHNLTFLLHHQADQIIDFLKKQKSQYTDRCEFNWIIENKPLDTGGAVANAIKYLNYRGDFLVVNADTWLSSGINEISSVEAPALAVVKLENTDRYGRVFFDVNSRITSFKEKSKNSGAGWINAGLCKLNSKYFNEWHGDAFSMEKDLYGPLTNQGNIIAVKLHCDFMDIGIPKDYIKFCQWVKEGKLEKI